MSTSVRTPWRIDPENPEQVVCEVNGKPLTQPRFAHEPAEFVGVDKDGEFVWIGVEEREKFDRIAAPVRDSGETEDGRVLTKVVEQGGVRVVFQHWLKHLTTAGISEQLDRKRAAREAAAKTEAGAA